MKNYRIKKVTDGYSTSYYPQGKKFGFLWWYNIFETEWVDGFETEWVDGSYYTFEEAQEHLCNYLRKPVVEYIDFDCERDCK